MWNGVDRIQGTFRSKGFKDVRPEPGINWCRVLEIGTHSSLADQSRSNFPQTNEMARLAVVSGTERHKKFEFVLISSHLSRVADSAGGGADRGLLCSGK